VATTTNPTVLARCASTQIPIPEFSMAIHALKLVYFVRITTEENEEKNNNSAR